ncbi:unnamed protein product, partial [Brassica napus]
IFYLTYNSRLPADELQLAIVEPKPLTLASGVSVKDDFFIHTPRKTIAEMIECRQEPSTQISRGHEYSIVSDAPEGSLMLLEEGSSQEGFPSELTPAKRRGGPAVNLEEEFDQNSVTKTGISTRVKKEKVDKSG